MVIFAYQSYHHTEFPLFGRLNVNIDISRVYLLSILSQNIPIYFRINALLISISLLCVDCFNIFSHLQRLL